jgi:hypothetical protein
MLWSDISQETQGGFIDAATGVFSADPHSVMVYDSATELTRTPDQPYLYSRGPGDVAMAAATYDGPQHRWLPVPREWVSPDGATYAYAQSQPGATQGVHIVNVATGVDRVVPGTSGDPDARGKHYGVIAYQPDGIYLNRVGQLGGIGLWLLNPATGAITQVSTDAPGVGVFVAGKQAWWTAPSANPYASTDPYVTHQYLTGVAGQHGETWFQRPGTGLHVLGIDTTGRALVLAQSASDEIWQLAIPNDSKTLTTMPNDRSFPQLVPFKTAVLDAAGWWIGSRTGVFLATTSGDFLHASTTPAVVVGGCT